MKKAYRIRKNEEFASLISKRSTRSSQGYVIYFDARKEDNARVGISVSKKLGNAVMRNKIKRQVRQMIGQVINLDEAIYDYIIIVRKPYLDRPFIENKKDLEKTLKACKID